MQQALGKALFVIAKNQAVFDQKRQHLVQLRAVGPKVVSSLRIGRKDPVFRNLTDGDRRLMDQLERFEGGFGFHRCLRLQFHNRLGSEP